MEFIKEKLENIIENQNKILEIHQIKNDHELDKINNKIQNLENKIDILNKNIDMLNNNYKILLKHF